MQSEPESELRVEIIPTMKLWAWVALELRHIPEFLTAIQLLNGCLARMPLEEQSQERLKKDLFEFEMALASQLVALDEADLERVSTLPDTLEGLGLLMARSALLYALGHEEILRADGSLPEKETPPAARELFTKLGNAGVRYRGSGLLILNDDGPQVLHTSIIGMDVFVRCGGDTNSILVAEAILGTLEAFFATALEMRVMPHTEQFHIRLEQTDGLEAPEFTIDTAKMTAVMKWPSSLSVTSYETQKIAGDGIFELVAHVLSATCMMQNVEEVLKRLFEDEHVHDRVSIDSADRQQPPPFPGQLRKPPERMVQIQSEALCRSA